MSDNAFYRFLGGHPIKVLLRLVLMSLVVGALLLWLDIRPVQIIEAAQRIGQRIYGMGFEAVREAGQYIKPAQLWFCQYGSCCGCSARAPCAEPQTLRSLAQPAALLPVSASRPDMLRRVSSRTSPCLICPIRPGPLNTSAE